MLFIAKTSLIQDTRVTILITQQKSWNFYKRTNYWIHLKNCTHNTNKETEIL